MRQVPTTTEKRKHSKDLEVQSKRGIFRVNILTLGVQVDHSIKMIFPKRPPDFRRDLISINNPNGSIMLMVCDLQGLRKKGNIFYSYDPFNVRKYALHGPYGLRKRMS